MRSFAYSILLCSRQSSIVILSFYPLFLADELHGTTIKQKIETICREIYGADGCDYSDAAEKKIEDYSGLGTSFCCRTCQLQADEEKSRVVLNA